MIQVVFLGQAIWHIDWVQPRYSSSTLISYDKALVCLQEFLLGTVTVFGLNPEYMPGPPTKVPKITAQHSKTETIASIGSIVLGLLEVRVGCISYLSHVEVHLRHMIL